MNIAFRVDASMDMGTGHVMRCLALADSLTKQGAQCFFLCRPHLGNLLGLISRRGHTPIVLGSPSKNIGLKIDQEPSLVHAAWLGTDWHTDAEDTLEAIGNVVMDWLIVDHYALDARWEQMVRKSCGHLMVIDDLADRAHDCDLLLDQNLGRNIDDYAQLVPADCPVLAGPKYALLRPEFARLRIESLTRRASAPELKRLLISMGGTDKDNATGAVLTVLRSVDLPAECRVTVVMGLQAPWLESVSCQVESLPWQAELLVDVQDMARLMTDSDLAIGAAGSTSWERCCLGLPTVLVVLAENQWPGARALQNIGCAVLLGEPADIYSGLKECIRIASDSMPELTQQSSHVTAGIGVEQVARRIC